jgi:hypothetical protein
MTKCGRSALDTPGGDGTNPPFDASTSNTYGVDVRSVNEHDVLSMPRHDKPAGLEVTE